MSLMRLDFAFPKIESEPVLIYLTESLLGGAATNEREDAPFVFLTWRNDTAL